MNRKRIGILLVILAVLIGTVAVITCFVGDQKPVRQKKMYILNKYRWTL